MRASTVVLLLGALLLAACGRQSTDSGAVGIADGEPIPPAQPELHQPFDALLASNVVDGLVDYVAFAESAQFKRYLTSLEQIDPSQLASPAERAAFYINGYNALVIDGILKSNRDGFFHGVADLGGTADESRQRFFGTTLRPIAKQKLSLDHIRNEILRQQFAEPRLQVAVSCASAGCPILDSAAWPPQQEPLEMRLDEAMRRFVRDPQRNRVTVNPPAIKLSQIFEWYGADFGADETALRNYLAAYLDAAERQVVTDPQVPIEYVAYDWSLNSR